MMTTPRLLLDQCPFDWMSHHGEVLLTTLSSALGEPQSASFVLRSVGIPPQAIHWGQKASHFWIDIIDVAASHGKLRKIVEHVLSREAYEGWHPRLLPLLSAPAEPPAGAERTDAPGGFTALRVDVTTTASCAVHTPMIARKIVDLNSDLERQRVRIRIAAQGAAASAGGPRGSSLHVFVLGPSSSEDLETVAQQLLDECARWRMSGHPEVVVYTAIAVPEALTELQRRHPERFESFDGSHDLAVKVERILAEHALRAAFPDEVLAPRERAGREVPRGRPWLILLEDWLLRAAPDVDGDDRRLAQRCATLCARRLEQLVDVRRALTDTERDALLGVCHVRALRHGTALERLLQAHDVDLASPAISARLVASIAADIDDHAPQGAARTTSAVRGDVVGSLVRAAEALLFDRAGASGALALSESSPLEAWAAAMTSEIRIAHGVATHVLRVGSTAAAATLERWLVLRFEACTRVARGPLGRVGVAIAIGSPEITLSRGYPDIPAPVLERFEVSSRQAFAGLSTFPHLGSGADPAPPLGLLFPLPLATIGDPLVVELQEDDPSTDMLLVPLTTDRERARSGAMTLMNRRGKLVLDPDHLRPSTTYRWAIRRDYGTGEPSIIAEGELRTLAAVDKARWRLGRDVGPEARRGLQVALGLWHELLTDIWCTSEAGPSPADLALALGIVAQGYEWLRRCSPGSAQIDTLRDVGVWIGDRLNPRDVAIREE